MRIDCVSPIRPLCGIYKSAPRWRESANDGSKTSCALPHRSRGQVSVGFHGIKSKSSQSVSLLYAPCRAHRHRRTPEIMLLLQRRPTQGSQTRSKAEWPRSPSFGTTPRQRHLATSLATLRCGFLLVFFWFSSVFFGFLLVFLGLKP